MSDSNSAGPVPFRTAAMPSERALALLGRDALAERLRVIQSVTDAALAHLELEVLLTEMLQRIRQALRVEVVRVLFCTPDGRNLSVRASLGVAEGGPEGSTPIPIGHGVAGWVAQHRQAVIVDQVATAPGLNPLLRSLHSIMVAPLLVQGELLGVLEVGTSAERRFDDADLSLLQLIADRLALAIERAKQHEAAVRLDREHAEAMQHYRSLFENNPDAVFALDRDGNFESVNPAAEAISGYPADELLGTSFVPLIAPEEVERTVAAFQRAVAGEPQALTTTITARDGRRVELSVTAVPITIDDQVTGVYGIAEDVTERNRFTSEQQRLLEELDLERAQLEAVLQQLPAGVLIAEAASGRLVLGNARLEQILRHPTVPGQLIDPALLWAGEHSDGRPLAPDEWPLARAIASGETTGSEEVLYRRGDGTRGWVRVNAAPIRDPEGRVVAGVVVFHDVDAERRALEGMRFLADASIALHTSLDHRTTIRQIARLAVPRFADWCIVDLIDSEGRPQRQEAAHRDSAKETLIKQLQHLYPSSYEDVEHPINRVLHTGKPLLIPGYTNELLESLAGDEEHLQILRSLQLVSGIIAPMRTRERAIGVITFATAESQRRYTPDDLALAEEVARRAAVAVENAELYEEAAGASQAKSDFLAVMSHELRTPLAAIMGYAELLQMGIPEPISEGALRQVERIDAAARHQLQLIEQILTFSRIAAGEEELEWSETDLLVPVQDSIAFIRPAAEQKELQLSIDLPRFGIPIRTDPTKVRQILVNLLFNAVQFTQEGVVEVTVSMHEDIARVQIRDTGIGIAPEHFEKIFEPFWQVRQSITREVGGTGLGLTVARRTARLLGGEISVQSTIGTGTTFSLHLPLEPRRGEAGDGGMADGRTERQRGESGE